MHLRQSGAGSFLSAMSAGIILGTGMGGSQLAKEAVVDPYPPGRASSVRDRCRTFGCVFRRFTRQRRRCPAMRMEGGRWREVGHAGYGLCFKRTSSQRGFFSLCRLCLYSLVKASLASPAHHVVSVYCEVGYSGHRLDC